MDWLIIELVTSYKTYKGTGVWKRTAIYFDPGIETSKKGKEDEAHRYSMREGSKPGKGSEGHGNGKVSITVHSLENLLRW